MLISNHLLCKDLVHHPSETTIQIHLVGDFNPLEKYATVKLDHFPNFRGENNKYLSCHHLDDIPDQKSVADSKVTNLLYHAFFWYLISSHVSVPFELQNTLLP